jgi:Ser/Thr protein kinase RdoA (MazF antagonist)
MSAAVLAEYGPAIAGLRWVPVAGGFSGALVWRGYDFALKAYPPHVTPERIAQVHAWMSRAAHLPFVPAVIPTLSRATFTTHAGRVWEIVRWMPGEPGLTSSPRVTNAVESLAVLHRTWTPSVPHSAPCPGVLRRLGVLRSWQPTAPTNGLLRRAADAVTRLAPHAVRALAPWAARPVPLQPCLCDVHAEHVLFVGDHVTGVIDYGAMKTDHVAVDLARLLGSADIDEPEFLRAVSHYRDRGEVIVDPALVVLLARSGTVCAAANWCHRATEVVASPQVQDHLTRLLRSVESFTRESFAPPP